MRKKKMLEIDVKSFFSSSKIFLFAVIRIRIWVILRPQRRQSKLLDNQSY